MLKNKTVRDKIKHVWFFVPYFDVCLAGFPELRITDPGRDAAERIFKLPVENRHDGKTLFYKERERRYEEKS